jgi:hypothetical protein
MEADRWKQVDRLLQLALEHPPAERGEFLRRACGEDAELEREVRSLLTSQERAGSFLESPAIQLAAQALAGEQDTQSADLPIGPTLRRTADSFLGRIVSNYRMEERLSAGGMGVLYRAMCLVHQAALTAVICAVGTTALAQTTPGQPERPQETPAGTTATTSLPAVAQLSPAHEIKLAENTWFRFGAQVQLWFKAAQDRIQQSDGSDGSYAYDFYCRRCRFFAGGSVVKDVFFFLLFESSNTGKGDPATGVKNSAVPQLLDAVGQVKFTQWLWLSGGQILMPLSRNGLQPTTTYVSIDNANVDTTPVLQTGNRSCATSGSRSTASLRTITSNTAWASGKETDRPPCRGYRAPATTGPALSPWCRPIYGTRKRDPSTAVTPTAPERFSG